MKREKYLLVEFPVDYGNAVLGRNLYEALSIGSDVKTFKFDSGSTIDTAKSQSVSAISRTFRRATFMRALRDTLSMARSENRVVLFQQISPALFSLPFLRGLRSFILLDWTRKLYEPILETKMSSSVDVALHRLAMSHVTGIIAFTEAAQLSVINDYRIPSSKVVRARMPFDVREYEVPAPTNSRQRILFVGADLQRKGGDILLDWFASRSPRDIDLTMVTQADVNVAGVRVIKNRPGESMVATYSSHDILALPTRCDAYPQVIGEGACAGLALVTTRTALGSPEVIVDGWNGFICDDPDNFKTKLDELVANPDLTTRFKINSQRHMVDNLSFERAAESISRATYAPVGRIGDRS